MAGVSNALPEEVRPAGIVAQSATPVASTQSSEANEEPKKEEKKEEPAGDAAASLGGFF